EEEISYASKRWDSPRIDISVEVHEGRRTTFPWFRPHKGISDRSNTAPQPTINYDRNSQELVTTRLITQHQRRLYNNCLWIQLSLTSISRKGLAFAVRHSTKCLRLFPWAPCSSSVAVVFLEATLLRSYSLILLSLLS